MTTENSTRTTLPRGLGGFGPALFLLNVCYIINYIDRGNVSVAAPLVRAEFGLSDSQLGILFSAFFASYIVCQFLVGWFVDRFRATRLLAAGFLVWSLATAATGLATGFAALLAFRLALGVAEAVALPCGTKIVAQHLAEVHRGFAGGVLLSGQRFGNALGTLVSGLLMARFGWRAVFVCVGLVSLLWLPAWKKWQPRETRAPSREEAEGPGLADFLRQRSFWGTSVGHFSTTYLFYFMITWLPSYLVMERHVSLGMMTRLATLYYTVEALSSIGAGWLQDKLIRLGHSPTVVRKTGMGLGNLLGAIGTLGCALASGENYVWWLLIAGVGCGSGSVGIFTYAQTLAGRASVGRWYGWQNCLGNFAGVVGPTLTGFAVQRTGSFLAPFAVTAGMCVLAIVAWVGMVGRLEPVDWGPRWTLPVGVREQSSPL